MTCKDCINYNNCIKRGDLAAINLTEDSEKECDLFKSKVDFVEVKCRCSECKHLKIINKEPVYAECERQKLTFLLWQADTREHTCSYGERRDT
jgi:hypothetical protein